MSPKDSMLENKSCGWGREHGKKNQESMVGRGWNCFTVKEVEKTSQIYFSISDFSFEVKT